MSHKEFNITGLCIPELHYMADMSSKIQEIITRFISRGAYFTINRARQYGKTTTLRLLEHALKDSYVVIRISFEGKEEYFSSLQSLAGGLSLSFSQSLAFSYPKLARIFKPLPDTVYPMQDLNNRIIKLCEKSQKPVILMIDEVDKASNNETFLSFLGMLRQMYLARQDYGAPAFGSVILAGVHDIKNLRMKIRPEERHTYNSPWNIAADFNVDMSLSLSDITGMLASYEQDYKTEMNISLIAELIFNYTSGYPYLVSRICKLVDEQLTGTPEFKNRSAAWTKDGIAEAVKRMMMETNTLFDDMRKQISEFPELKNILYSILFNGRSFPYNPDNSAVNIGTMFGFIKEDHGMVSITNRIFETRLYNLFLSEEMTNNLTYEAGLLDRNILISDGKLNMELILQKFVKHYTEIYTENNTKFLEENGRRLFLLYLKPIINGTGNYYIEARTRDLRRTDIIIDYRGQQYVIELKIWHGEEYNRRGEQQLLGYLEEFHLTKGYMLSFNFNKKKTAGVRDEYSAASEPLNPL